ncbi:hypothetical protein DVH05_027935 [Phytophthora capsici]|nr:hypothetical protein DVH05_027935 [Phytophthora capsici]
MKPFSTGALAGLLFASALVQGTSGAPWDVKAEYDDATCTASKVSALTLGASSTSTCTGNDQCSTNVTPMCTTDSGYKAKIASVFGSTKYVTVSKYAGVTECTGTPSSVTAYAVTDPTDCHRISLSGAVKGFKVTGVSALGSSASVAKIEFFTSDACTSALTPTIDILVSKSALISGCDATTTGGATRIEVSDNWPVVIQATPSFDGTLCSSAVALISSVIPGTCTADTNCGSSTAGVICTTDTDYKADFATQYGTTPHVIVSTFSGSACTSMTLSTLNAYAADGKCHKFSSTKYYNVPISNGVATATVSFFSDAECKMAHSDSPNTIEVTRALVNANSGCVTSAGQTAVRYEFSTSWHTAMTASFDGGDCGKALAFISVTNAACTGAVDCVDTTTAGSICTTNYNYESAIASTFGSTTPYLTITKFQASVCSWSAVASATAYIADGKCHMWDLGKYYKLSVTPIGGSSEPKIWGYTDPGCTIADTVTANTFEVSRAKLNSNSGLVPGCVVASNLATQYKVSSTWPRAMSVAGVGTYAVTSCAGAPSKLTFTDAAGSTACTATTPTCTTALALTDCTSSATYKEYLKTAFGSVPYLIKEAYTGTNCATRGTVTAWAADGTCIVDGVDSFKVVATSGGIAQRIYSGVKDCTATTSTDRNPVTAAQLVSNACVSNAKYYMGGSWVLSSSAVYDDNKCALTPNKLTLGYAPTCTTPTGADSCVETATTGATPKTVYNAPGCAKTSNYFSVIDKAFGMTSYVVQESYTSSCGLLIGVSAFVADAKCHLGADAASSYNVTYDVNGTTAQVKIDSFTNTDCTTPASTTTSVAAAAITGKTCVADTKTYVGGLATKLTAVTTYADKDCKEPVQTVFTSPASTCTAVTACTASGTLFTKTACTNAKTDYSAILATVYTTTRRLVSDIYEAKDTNKCGTRQGIVAYVGDGNCHTTLDGTFFKVTLGSSNTLTDATFSTFSDKDCTKDEKPLTIAAGNLAVGTTAPCDVTNSIKWSIGGTEPPTEAPATTAPTPAPTTAVSTGSGKSAAVSSFSVSIFGLLVSILGGFAVLLN